VRRRPQRPRIQIADGIYHVTARGNQREPIYTDTRSRERFLFLLDDVVDRMRWRVHAYCLMTNHYHLLVETPEPNIGRGMERLNGIYARWFNWRHGREGHVFGRRYGDELVERDAHLFELARYIVLNPVRAKLCAHPSEWRWSSYNATVAQVPEPSFLSVDWMLKQFGTTPAAARKHYADFVAGSAAV
jgi:putative transposase